MSKGDAVGQVLTARSVVLSVLLGAHPAWSTAAELLRLTSDFGIREPTLRVALTRMAGNGDLVRSDNGYRLSDRLLARQRRQDDALNPVAGDWNGDWITAVITVVGADARTRAALRTALLDKRFGELREGIWLRPDNLDGQLPAIADGRIRLLSTRDDDPEGLARQLWDLPGWSHAGHRLLARMNGATTIPDRFTLAAAMVRHLLTDPVLPTGLLPADWPADGLRAAYTEFADLLTSRRDGDLLETR